MSKKWMITGDTHGGFSRCSWLPTDEEINLIILGDAGFNFGTKTRMNKCKTEVHKKYPNITFYCVRGNHEDRPENIEGMKLYMDDEVRGLIYSQPEFPNIKYFYDGGHYLIDNYTVLVIGGAYSVDKYYRLANHWTWYPQEQLTEGELNFIKEKYTNKTFDAVLTHTCPYSWRPTDKFLPFINQDRVETTMEEWLDKIKEVITYKVWGFGHFHNDRYERPGVVQYYNAIDDFEDFMNRDESQIPESLKSPNYEKKDL